MSLVKEIIVDRIEVVESGVVQVRTCTKIMEDGKQISGSFHRHTVAPGDDYSTEDARVQAICAATHDAATVAAYKAKMAENAAQLA